MYCQKCGAEVLDGDRFCLQCGTEIISTNSDMSQTMKSSGETTTVKSMVTAGSKKDSAIIKILAGIIIIGSLVYIVRVLTAEGGWDRYSTITVIIALTIGVLFYMVFKNNSENCARIGTIISLVNAFYSIGRTCYLRKLFWDSFHYNRNLSDSFNDLYSSNYDSGLWNSYRSWISAAWIACFLAVFTIITFWNVKKQKK